MNDHSESNTYLLDRGGQVLGGRYRVTELLGVGAMGSVWVAELMSLKQSVVVKFHEEGFAANEGTLALKRFLQEARTLSQVRHRNVIELYEAGRSEDGSPYLIMERLHGRSLAAAMRERSEFEVEEAFDIAIAIAHGLRAVHEAGVLHRDIKPENIFLHEAQDAIVPKLIDFGLAFEDVLSQKDRLTRGNRTVGTPGYMAPEQARGTRGLDHRVDLYSLGVTLYEMLTARLPAEGSTGMDLMIFAATEDPIPLTRYRKDLAGPIGDVVMRALARKREDRYDDAKAMVAALTPFGSEAPAKRER